MASDSCKECSSKDTSTKLLKACQNKLLGIRAVKQLPIEEYFVVHLIMRTNLTGRKIEDIGRQVCSGEGCEMVQKHKTCFFSEMSKFEDGIDGKVLKTCIFLMMVHENKDYRVSAIDALSTLLPEEPQDVASILKIPEKKFAERLSLLPHYDTLKKILSELGYYLTWVRSVSLNVRKFVKLAEKCLPPYFDQNDRFMATYLHSTPITPDSECLEKITLAHETTLYQKAFLGDTGFYGIFYQFLFLTLKSINPGPMGNLRLLFWMFDLDVRRAFLSMQEAINTSDSELYKSTMPLIWPRESLCDPLPTKAPQSKQTSKCECGRAATRSFFVIKGNFTLPIDLSVNLACDQHSFEQVKYCDQMCYLNDLAKMVPALKDAMSRYQIGYSSNKDNRHAYLHSCSRLQYSSVRTDMDLLMRTAAKIHQTTKKWPQPKDVESEGFSWSKWKPFHPKTQKTPGKKLRFCWSPLCPDLGLVAADNNLKICSFCRKARYCRKECAVSNWEDHRNYCFKMATNRVLKMSE